MDQVKCGVTVSSENDSIMEARNDNRTLEWQLSDLQREIRTDQTNTVTIEKISSTGENNGLIILDDALRHIESHRDITNGALRISESMKTESSVQELTIKPVGVAAAHQPTKVSTVDFSGVLKPELLTALKPELTITPVPASVVPDPGPHVRLCVEVPGVSTSASSSSSSSTTAVSSVTPSVSVTSIPQKVFSGPPQVTPITGQMIGAPLMVTGVVIPRAPLSSNLISFVDASGNMQLAAVASPVLNQIHIRPGMMVNTSSSTASPVIVNPSVPTSTATGNSVPRAVGTIVPVSSLTPIQPPIFKSTVRTIQPNKILVKNFVPAIKIENSKTTPVACENRATVIPIKLNEAQITKIQAATIKSENTSPAATTAAVVAKVDVKSEPMQAQTVSSPENIDATSTTICSEDKKKVTEEGDVKDKILSVSSSQGVRKADELTNDNLFHLVKHESNVVITAPSTAVQDILDQLKKEFPDKKFVINYSSSKTASDNIKSLVQGVAAGAALKRPEQSSSPQQVVKKRKYTRKQQFSSSTTTSTTANAASTSSSPPKPIRQTRSPSKPVIPLREMPSREHRRASLKRAQNINYKSARLRGEKAPELFEKDKNGVPPPSPPPPAQPPQPPPPPPPAPRRPGRPPGKTPGKPGRPKKGTQPPARRGRPRKVNIPETAPPANLQKTVASRIVEEDSLSSSVSSSEPSGDYNSEIRVGEEYQAVLEECRPQTASDNYEEEKATLVYHPEKGLLDSTRPETAKACSDFPLYDFVEWTCQEKRIFKRYLGAYKTKFAKYLAVLPNKRLLDIIDHYYSTHSPARDYVLPKKSKHYYLVSKNKPIVPPKGVFGIINEKRKVVPNRRFAANSNIVLYEDALPTRKPRELREIRKEGKPVSNGRPLKTEKPEEVAKPIVAQPRGAPKKTVNEVISPATSIENSDGAESEPSSDDDSLGYGMKKARPVMDYSDDVKDLISKDMLPEIPTLDEDLERLKEEVNTMKNTYARNKAECGQMDVEVKKIAKSVEAVNKAIGKARKITDNWSEEDRLLTIQAFRTYGKDFKAVSKLVGTKSEQAIKGFYDTNAQRYGLDIPVAPEESSEDQPEFEMTSSQSSTQSISSPSKSNPPDSPARVPRPMPSILRRKIGMKPLKS